MTTDRWSEAETPAEILGLRPSATAGQVRRAYRRLARALHPDRNPDPTAAARFARVTAARDQLLAAIERRDLRGPDPIRPDPEHVRSDAFTEEREPPSLVEVVRVALYVGAALVWLVFFLAFLHFVSAWGELPLPSATRPTPAP